MGQRRRGRGRRRVAGFCPGERRAHPASQRRNGRARRYGRQQRRFPARLTTSADAQSDINACCHCGTDTDADRFSHTERATIGHASPVGRADTNTVAITNAITNAVAAIDANTDAIADAVDTAPLRQRSA